jgi:hypothetical protein
MNFADMVLDAGEKVDRQPLAGRYARQTEVVKALARPFRVEADTLKCGARCICEIAEWG